MTRNPARNRVCTKRVYPKPAAEDGVRVLVERLWPRGVTKAKARVDLRLKEIAPSPELREGDGHDVGKWIEFRKRHRGDLRNPTEAVRILRRLAKDGPVTLIYAARDEEHNSASVSKQFLMRKR